MAFCGFVQVCDGHGGADAARFASQNLLRFLLVTPGLRKNLKAAIVSAQMLDVGNGQCCCECVLP